MRESRGNALFLILIAVALFAALSYAVTQSGRGGGSVSKEQAIIAAAQITQYGASLETAVNRMVLTGTNSMDLVYCSPADGGCSSNGIGGAECETGEDCLFAAEGGGAVPLELPSSAESQAFARYMLLQGSTLAFLTVDQIGSDATHDDLLIAYGISQEVCESINDGLGLASPPLESDGNAGDITSFPGVYAACYQDDDDSGDAYMYYHVLRAR